ncbi:MAG: amidohydrolase family protein [Planctomycetota bacterium]
MTSTASTLWRDLTLVPMDGPSAAPCGQVQRADLRIEGDRIAAIGALEPRSGETLRDGRHLVAIPGFVQGHLHFCQTLFRGLADDLPLMEWLRTRIWPLEAAHDAESVRVSAELTLCELLRGGTTSAQSMETVHHTEQTFAVCEAAGFSLIAGNCLMDQRDDGVPPGLVTGPDEALRISAELRRDWHGRGRLQYAVSPRFVLSCSDRLAREAAVFAQQHALRVHTHACEHRGEIGLVRARFGRGYLDVLRDQGLLGPRTGLAHCVHVDDAGRALLVEHQVAVLHCPSANLKLGSGVAPVADYARRGLRIALGADGAPCNNRLSALTEMRQAALLQAMHSGPGAWTAQHALHAATRGGAEALGLPDVGRIAPGLRADLVLFDLRDPRLGVGADPIGTLVFAAQEEHIDTVVLGGREVVRAGQLVDVDRDALAACARTHAQRCRVRAGC